MAFSQMAFKYFLRNHLVPGVVVLRILQEAKAGGSWVQALARMHSKPHKELVLFNLGMVLYAHYLSTWEVEAGGKRVQSSSTTCQVSQPLGYVRPCLKTTTKLSLPFKKLSLVLFFFTNIIARHKSVSVKNKEDSSWSAVKSKSMSEK